jgi:hypothetical protein
VTTHDFRQLCSVRRTTGRRVDDLCGFAEILRSYRRWRDHAERFHVTDSIVIEPVNDTARNTECLPGPTSIGFPSTVQVDTPSMP